MNKVDLLFDDYTTLAWPDREIHSRHFPYLVIRTGFGVYAPIAISQDLSALGEKNLIEEYKNFPDTYGYQACLVMNESKCFYFMPGGIVTENNKPPSGGSIINWRKFRTGSIKVISGSDDKRIFCSKSDNERSYEIIVPNP